MFADLKWLLMLLTRRQDDRQEQVVTDPVAKHPAKMGVHRLLQGRSIHVAVDEKGWHMRRRARQLRRDFGRGVTIPARPRDDAPTFHRPVKARWFEWL